MLALGMLLLGVAKAVADKPANVEAQDRQIALELSRIAAEEKADRKRYRMDAFVHYLTLTLLALAALLFAVMMLGDMAAQYSIEHKAAERGEKPPPAPVRDYDMPFLFL